MLFVHIFSRRVRKLYLTRTRFSVEYGLVSNTGCLPIFDDQLRLFLRRFKTDFSGILDLYAIQMINRVWEMGHRQKLKRLDD